MHESTPLRKRICYSLRDANNGNKYVGGLTTAESLDDAARYLFKQLKLRIQTTVRTYGVDRDVLNESGRKVNLHLHVSPEYLLALGVDDEQIVDTSADGYDAFRQEGGEFGQ